MPRPDAAPHETPYERHVRECQEAGIPLANAPFVRCDCDYFEGAWEAAHG